MVTKTFPVSLLIEQHKYWPQHLSPPQPLWDWIWSVTGCSPAPVLHSHSQHPAAPSGTSGASHGGLSQRSITYDKTVHN